MNTKVYKVLPGNDAPYESVIPSHDLNFRSLQRIRGQAVREQWQPMQMQFVSQSEGVSLVSADFPWLMNDFLVMKQRAATLMASYLEPYGELLPLECDTEKLHLFNTTNIVDALDKERSTFVYLKSGKLVSVRHFEFDSTIVQDNMIFRIPQLLGLPLLVTSSFVELIESTKLTGLQFDLIWNG